MIRRLGAFKEALREARGVYVEPFLTPSPETLAATSQVDVHWRKGAPRPPRGY